MCLLAGCGLLGAPKPLRQDAPQVMTVTSPVFGDEVIPREYTCHGTGQSPPIYWSGVPQGTKSIALVVDDAEAPITPYVYWIVFDISPARSYIQAGQPPPGAREALNSMGQARFDPPCPDGHRNHYRFTVYALSSRIHLPGGVGLKEAWQAIARNAIARGRLTVAAGPAPAA
jgi:Raf kinase inhibitor-like YbhB/YbcL family protein